MKNIYVGNISFETTEAEVRSLFEPYGQVDSVSLVTDKFTGQPRGFGFVEMPDNDAAGRAIDGLNGTSIGGRSLTVNEARPKEDRPRRSGAAHGGHGGGGGNRRSGGGGGGGGWRR